MSIRQAIRERIQQVTEVGNAGGKVFFMRQPSEADTPCIVFGVTGGSFEDPTTCLDQTDIETATVEWIAISNDAEEAISLQEAVKDALKGASWTAAGTEVQMCRIISRLPDEYYADEEVDVYACGCSMEVTYAPVS